MNYWFRPKRFWKWFAFFVPTSIAGYLITMVLLVLAIYVFITIEQSSYSGSDALFRFAPWAIGLMLIFDFLCFRFGEYPSWWRKTK